MKNDITALEHAKHFREQIKPLLKWMFHDAALTIRLTELKPLNIHPTLLPFLSANLVCKILTSSL